MDVDECVDIILKENPEDVIYGCIDESMYDFVNSDWEDEFESVYDAYCETGNGEAENQVITQLVLGMFPEIESDVFLDIQESLCERLGIVRF